MKQLMILLLLCLGSYSAAVSQVTSQAPQYYYAPQFDDTTLAITNNFSSVAFTQGFGISSMPSQKWVCIYYPRNFKYPPKGKITSMYFWIDVAATSDTNGLYKFYNSKIRMGTTTRDSFSYDSINKRFIVFDDEKELTTVLQGNPYIFDSTSLQGSPIGFGLNHKKWLKIPLQVPFLYDPLKNLVIQAFTNYDTLHDLCSIIPFAFKDSLTLNMTRLLGVDDTCGKYAHHASIGANSLLACIGFDLDTTGISGVEEIQATSLQLYPNPAKASIHFSLKGSYTISTLQGAIVQQGEGDVANIASLSQGLYIVQLLTKNGERLVGRFLKE